MNFPRHRNSLKLRNEWDELPRNSSRSEAKIEAGSPPIPRDPRSHHQLQKSLYCLLYTRTLFTSCPFAFLPLNVEVRVFPSFETTDVTVITTWPSFFIVDWMVLELTRCNATISELGEPVTG